MLEWYWDQQNWSQPCCHPTSLILICVEICIAVTIPLKCFPQVSEFTRETFCVTDLVSTRNVEKLHVLVMHDGVTAWRQGSKLVVLFQYVLDSYKALWPPVCPGMSATCLFLCSWWTYEMLHNFSKFFHSTWPHEKTYHLHFCIMFSIGPFSMPFVQSSMKEFTTTSASSKSELCHSCGHRIFH